MRILLDIIYSVFAESRILGNFYGLVRDGWR